MHPNPRRVIPVVLLVIILAVTWFVLNGRQAAADTGALTASGTIEATTINIAPELGGRVLRVLVNEGEAVKQGDVLVEFDSTLLETQRTQAAAALAAARAGLEASQAAQAAASANHALLQAGASPEQLAVAQAAVDAAQVAVDYLQQTYDDLPEFAQDAQAGKDLQFRLDQAKAGLATAQAQYAVAKAGPRAQQIEAAQAQADAAAAQVEALTAQADAAQAALNVLDVQLRKLKLVAPAEGVVLSRAIEPGEFAAPGATLLVVGQLTELFITVYAPEDRYANIALNQTAQVTADSFAGQTFTAQVTHIADSFEFTPRNVQTVEGRKSTVFAIKLKVANPEGKLKPGMPADVKFGN